MVPAIAGPTTVPQVMTDMARANICPLRSGSTVSTNIAKEAIHVAAPAIAWMMRPMNRTETGCLSESMIKLGIVEPYLTVRRR